jgi:hypothetical protein
VAGTGEQLVIRAMRRAIDRYGQAEARADQIALLAGADRLDESGWRVVEQWLYGFGLAVLERPPKSAGPKGKVVIVPAPQGDPLPPPPFSPR